MGTVAIKMAPSQFQRVTLPSKKHYLVVLPFGREQRFKKLAYFSLDDSKSHLVLIHYVGDKNIAVQNPHGNSKTTTHSFYIGHLLYCISFLVLLIYPVTSIRKLYLHAQNRNSHLKIIVRSPIYKIKKDKNES